MIAAPDSLERLFADARTKNADPLWIEMEAMVPPNPAPSARAAIWRYAEMRPLLERAGDLVGTADAERRVFMLTNPALRPPYTTDTLYAGLQLIRPGEVARAHRHVAFALRFIVEGHQAYTAVGGEKVVMERGDLVLTPSWEYHDHGNESPDPMIWLDGLDLPLLHAIRVNFAEAYHEERYPSEAARGASRLRYPWAEMQPRLDAEPGAFAECEYPHRENGGAIASTLGAAALRVDAGATTAPLRETASAIYHVIEGRGESRIGDTTLAWERGDTFCIPSWTRTTHTNAGDARAYLFRFDDRPLLRALSWYRRDDAVQNRDTDRPE